MLELTFGLISLEVFMTTKPMDPQASSTEANVASTKEVPDDSPVDIGPAPSETATPAGEQANIETMPLWVYGEYASSPVEPFGFAIHNADQAVVIHPHHASRVEDVDRPVVPERCADRLLQPA